MVSAHRGTVLLLTLFYLVVILSGAAAVVMHRVEARLETRLDEDALIADDLAGGTEPLIYAWLGHADEVVLPPDAEAPAVLVADDAWGAGRERITFRITAFDQYGMVAVTERDARMRRTLPPSAAGVVERGTPRGLREGLDLLRATAVDVFPVGVEIEGTARATPGVGAAAMQRESSGPAAVDEALFRAMRLEREAIGGCLATRNPGGKVNASTAPRALLEAACALDRSRDAQEILRRRSEGVRPMAAPDSPQGRARTTRLVNSSDAWAFRVDVEFGLVRRSWWQVYERTGSGTRRIWKMVQRLAIPG